MVMRSQITSFSSDVSTTQFATSTKVRPQPRQMMSKVVEHTATQGESGRFSGLFIKVRSLRFGVGSQNNRLGPFHIFTDEIAVQATEPFDASICQTESEGEHSSGLLQRRC